MYAIVRTGGKQYRVERGQRLLVERLPVQEGESLSLEPLLFVDGEQVLDGGGESRVRVEARVLGHERGTKLRVVKFKPKRGYKRRTGHRQQLTRIEITAIESGESSSRSRSRKQTGSGRKRSTARGTSTAPADEQSTQATQGEKTPATQEGSDGS